MIHVAMTRAELERAQASAEAVVVIDVLRASSTVTQALAAGYERVICAASVSSALELRGPNRVLAGERAGVAPAGFDQGNSPAQAAQRRGRELVLATTNGTPAIVAAAACAPLVLCGCLLNLPAVCEALHAELDLPSARVLLACSGTDGAVALEDVYCAGRLSRLLPGPRSDAAAVAEAVARAHPTPLAALSRSGDAAMLRATGQEGDIELCARVGALHLVGRLRGLRSGGAVLEPWARRPTVRPSQAKRTAAAA